MHGALDGSCHLLVLANGVCLGQRSPLLAQLHHYCPLSHGSGSENSRLRSSPRRRFPRRYHERGVTSTATTPLTVTQDVNMCDVGPAPGSLGQLSQLMDGTLPVCRSDVSGAPINPTCTCGRSAGRSRFSIPSECQVGVERRTSRMNSGVPTKYCVQFHSPPLSDGRGSSGTKTKIPPTTQ